ncbi:MAG: helix-turn-helix transcriptional regulator [Steroidobacteraceae bacterium]
MLHPPPAPQALFNGLEDPLFLIDARRRLLQHNEAAERVLKARTALRSHAGLLAFTDPDTATRLERVMAEYGTQAVEAWQSRALRVPATSSGCDWLAVLTPLAGVCHEPHCLLHLVRRAGGRSLPRRALRDLFALTPKELDVVEQLLAGKPLREAAGVLRLSYGTIRVYLKQIFFKCEVSSQTGLALLVQRLSLLSDFLS